MASTADYRTDLSILLLRCLVLFGGDIDESLPWITWMQILGVLRVRRWDEGQELSSVKDSLYVIVSPSFSSWVRYGSWL